ncbi:iron-sulfur cluster assembly scaffold protein [Candidatus Tremblaya princeps]|uniref:Iron-sulfur cluster assembly scaffold protein IscU n=1 Tax=Tremblaya princeps TaxID=189385 RepID=A0A1C3K932_TREPR|nr:iron-sulfur cluster assembly scaffold protein [Candidatus Tremblaya princeps]SBT63011.1 Iron-sulfur cluster assembly scaffold protein IscU [Candidatus Tremblaya princeps]
MVMGVYSKRVIRYCNYSRNIGSLPEHARDVVTCVAGEEACCDVMRLQVSIRHGMVDEVRFQMYDCGSASCESSLVARWIEGRPLEEALAVRNSAIAHELGLPPVKIHCSRLASEALRAAVADYRSKNAQQCGG